MPSTLSEFRASASENVSMLAMVLCSDVGVLRQDVVELLRSTSRAACVPVLAGVRLGDREVGGAPSSAASTGAACGCRR